MPTNPAPLIRATQISGADFIDELRRERRFVPFGKLTIRLSSGRVTRMALRLSRCLPRP